MHISKSRIDTINLFLTVCYHQTASRSHFMEWIWKTAHNYKVFWDKCWLLQAQEYVNESKTLCRVNRRYLLHQPPSVPWLGHFWQEALCSMMAVSRKSAKSTLLSSLDKSEAEDASTTDIIFSVVYSFIMVSWYSNLDRVFSWSTILL